MNKWIFFGKLSLIIFMSVGIFTIIVALLGQRDEALVLGSFFALLIAEGINFVIAIIEEPLIRWLM